MSAKDAGPLLLLRADAGPVIGAGHVMRCLAFAQEWQDLGGRALFATATDFPSLASRLVEEGCDMYRLPVISGSVDDADALKRLASETGAAWIVLDGYAFDSAYQKRLCELPCVTIDDNATLPYYWTNGIVNPNLGASEALYPASRRGNTSWICAGWEYCPLRRDYLQATPKRFSTSASFRRVLLTFGGGDPDNVTGKVLDALARLPDAQLEVRLVIGGLNPHRDALQRQARTFPGSVEILQAVRDMPSLMQWADCALCAGGTTADELLFMNVPFLAMILAENQRPVVEAGVRLGVFGSLGEHKTAKPAALSETIGAWIRRGCDWERTAPKQTELRRVRLANSWMADKWLKVKNDS